MRICVLVGCVAAVIGLTGCPSYTTAGLARPIAKGTVQTTLTPGAQNYTGSYFGVTIPLTWPQIEAGIRWGVSDSLELSGKVWLLGVEGEAKYAILQSATLDSGVDISIAPSLGLTCYGVIGTLSASVPLLIGINFGGNQLVLGPKAVEHIVGGPGGVGHMLMAGTSIGYAIRINDEFRVMPELTALIPVFFGVAGQSGGAGAGGFIGQLSVGLMWGGKYASAPPAIDGPG